MPNICKPYTPQRESLYFHENMKCNEAMDLEILMLSSWFLGNYIFAVGANAVTVKLIVMMLYCFPFSCYNNINIWHCGFRGLKGGSQCWARSVSSPNQKMHSHHEVTETFEANPCNAAVILIPQWSFCLPDPDGLVPTWSWALFCLQEASMESISADRCDNCSEGDWLMVWIFSGANLAYAMNGSVPTQKWSG